MRKVIKKVLFIPELFFGVIIFALILISIVPLSFLWIVSKITKL